MEKTVPWKLVPSAVFTDRATASDKMVSAGWSRTSFNPTVSTIPMILTRTWIKLVHVPSLGAVCNKIVNIKKSKKVWNFWVTPYHFFNTTTICHWMPDEFISNLLEVVASTSGEASSRLLTMRTEVFPSSRLTVGPDKRSSSWDTSCSTWLEFRLDTSLVRSSSALAWLSAGVNNKEQHWKEMLWNDAKIT